MDSVQYMSLMRNPRHLPDVRPSDFQADPIKRLPTIQPNVIEQRKLLTNLHLARARTDLALAISEASRPPRISAECRLYRHKLSPELCASSTLGGWAIETRSIST